MDLYSGFCNICYKTVDGNIKNISEENVKNLKNSLITFVGHADIVTHNVINLCQLCCEELTRFNKFREMCLTNLIQLPQRVLDMKSKLEYFCNICYKADNRCLKDTFEENMKNLKDTLITFVGHADIINDNIIHLCQSCCEELKRSNKFREICFTHFIQLRQSVIDMKSKLELENDTSAIENKLQIFVHQEVLRRYTLEKSNCPFLIPTEYEIIESSAVLSKNHSVFNREIINLQSERNECPLAGDCSDLPVINSATKCESDDVEYRKEEFHVKKEIVLSDPEDFECKSDGHVSEGMINSGFEYMEEALYVKQENSSSEDLKLDTIEDEFGNSQNVPIEFVNVCSIVKTEECETESNAFEGKAQDDMNLPSRGCNSKFTGAIMQPDVHGRVYPCAEPHTPTVCTKASRSSKPYKCTICNKTFTDSSNLTRHERLHSGDRPYKCTECNKSFVGLSGLSNHKRAHSGRLHKCRACNKKFADSPSLATHQLTHGDRPYKCTVCNLSFVALCGLANHKRTHNGIRPYTCTVCNKAFTKLTNFTIHERIHNGDRPHKCTICNMSFTQPGHLTSHQRIHSGDKPYKCTVCNKPFMYSSDLTKHERMHSGVKPYKCTFCNKAFLDSAHLNMHERIHIADRPYKCIVCNKTFKQLPYLTTHQRTHTGDKPYKCTICNKAFSQSSNLATHKRIHSGDKRYKCIVCNKGYTKAYLLTAHEHTHSGENTNADLGSTNSGVAPAKIWS